MSLSEQSRDVVTIHFWVFFCLAVGFPSFPSMAGSHGWSFRNGGEVKILIYLFILMKRYMKSRSRGFQQNGKYMTVGNTEMFSLIFFAVSKEMLAAFHLFADTNILFLPTTMIERGREVPLSQKVKGNFSSLHKLVE